MSQDKIATIGSSKQNNNKKLPLCRFCKSGDIVKKGYRQTQKRGKIQRWLCHNCERSFTINEGFLRMKNNENKITMAIDMYLSNLSSRKMRNQLLRHFEYRISHVSVLDWVRRYTLKVYNYVDKLKYNVGDEFFADETFINRQGHDDRFWACVDWDTRLITGVHYSLSGNPEEAEEFLKKAVEKGKPKYIQTDGAGFYPRAFRRLFYSNKERGLTVKHKIQNYQRTGIHNYKIETVFMKIKDRVYDFRGLKALWSAPILLAGIVLQHNFIEKHTTLNHVPCDIAQANLDVGINRWLGLIQLSSRIEQ